jgi:hypothetical protein
VLREAAALCEVAEAFIFLAMWGMLPQEIKQRFPSSGERINE